MLETCPKMTTEPYAGSYGLCPLKIPDGNSFEAVTCNYMGKDNWAECPLYQHQKYEEMSAVISSEQME